MTNELELLIDFFEKTNARIDIYDMWMVKDKITREWIIYQRKPRDKKTKKLLTTRSLQDALTVLEYRIKTIKDGAIWIK